MKNYLFLRKKYPKFVYERYSYKIVKNDLKISFDFKIKPDICFKPKIRIKNINKKRLALIGKGTLSNLIFHLGLIELISYWKATCSPEIEIRAGFLNKEQIKWWKGLIMKGMGQFFYENKINFTQSNFLKISSSPNMPRTVLGILKEKLKDGILVPIGGGKDSIVTLEILKKSNKNIKCFCLNPNKSVKKIIKIADCQNPIIVERKIDKKLLELNQRGYLNGHTPFSAYLAFLSVLCAVIFDYKYIAFSQERSSNEGNLRYLPPHHIKHLSPLATIKQSFVLDWCGGLPPHHNEDKSPKATKSAKPVLVWCGGKGKIINHQYSKSFEFEQKFRNYSKRYLAKQVEYFSFLRPLYEIQIAKLFSNFPQYFFAFLSCNVAQKTYSGTKKPIGKWCGDCPKCLFVFTSLYPFVEHKKLIKIFGKNLFEDKKLMPVMLELIGKRKFKPFECVGTKKESLIAFYLSYLCAKTHLTNLAGAKKIKLPFLLRYFQEKILPQYQNLKRESRRIMSSWNKQNNLPKNLEKMFKKLTKNEI